MKINLEKKPKEDSYFFLSCNKEAIRWRYRVYLTGALSIQFWIKNKDKIGRWEYLTEKHVKKIV